MSSTESSGAPAEATATPPAPAAEFPSFGTTRGSGLARGKRPTSSAAASTTAASSDYKPTAIEVVTAPREYTNPFAPATPEPAERTDAPAVAPAASAPIETPAASFVPAPAPVAPIALAPVARIETPAPAPVAEEEPAQLNILPPAEAKSAPAQTWESDGFRPNREARNERSRAFANESAPRREESPASSESSEEPVDIASIPEKFLYVRPGVTFVPTPRNWGGAPRERSERNGDRNRPASGGESAPRREESSFRPSASTATPAAAEPAPSGGFLGWLKSLFGGSPAPAPEPVVAAQSDESRRDGGERRHRGGRGRGGPGGGGGGGGPGGERRHRGGRNRHRNGGGAGAGPAST